MFLLYDIQVRSMEDGHCTVFENLNSGYPCVNDMCRQPFWVAVTSVGGLHSPL